MWNVSQRYGVSVDQVIAANGGSSTIKLGQKLTIPGANGSGRAGERAARRGRSEGHAGADARRRHAGGRHGGRDRAAGRRPGGSCADRRSGAAGCDRRRSAPAAPQAAAASDGFRWPVRGRVISGFGKKPDGERNDGINLAVPEGHER